MLLAVMQKLTFRFRDVAKAKSNLKIWPMAVSYTHLRAHET